MTTRLLKPTGTALLLLTVALFVVTWPFFAAFTIATFGVGLAAAVAMRSWHWRHPSKIALPDRLLRSEINVSSIPVRGDVGGLLFAIAAAAILLGLSPIRWFLVGSLLCAAVFALALIAWRQHGHVLSDRRVRLLQ
ncbi:MAG TPA: hypothetical protein VKB50_21880 [Vicinamibacterales bacterium]|nr:hypothetical protein [Vicinamibacterales bacterium]